MKHKILFLLSLAIVATVSLQAQLNVGSTAPADVSAILQATSTTKGFLPPVMTTTQINSIVLPANGLTVYNTTLSQLQVNVGTTLIPSWAVGAGGANVYWSQQGNTGTVPGTNYVGTTDNASLAFGTNNAERVRIDSSTGFVGIGTTTPHAPLQLANTVVTRKLVLFDNVGNAGNDSAFYGFGVNSSTLRYQAPAGASHSFYSNKAQVATIVATGQITSMGTIPGFAFNDRSRTVVNSLYANNGIIRLWGSQNGDLLTVDSVGNVGINNSASYAPLQFANTLGNRKIVLKDSGVNAANDSSFYGLGVNAGTLRYQVPSAGKHSFYVNKVLMASIGSTGIASDSVLVIDNTAKFYGNFTPGLTGPSLRFGGLSGEGISSTRANGAVNFNGLDLITNWGPRLSITNGGNVGIGIQTPSRSLQVNGAIKSGLDNQGSINLSTGSASTSGFVEFYKSNGTTRLGFIGFDNTNLNYQAENGAVHLFQGNADFNTSLGVGTTTPSSRLQIVAGDNNTTTLLDVQPNNQTIGTGLWYGGVRSTGSNTNNPLSLDGKGNGNVLLNANGGSGNVGIGTNAPGEKLELNGNIRLGVEPGSTILGWGNYIEFDGNGVNSDPIGLVRYNTAGNQSELRMIIGDDPVNSSNGGADRFVIGAIPGSGNVGGLEAGTFTPAFFIYSNGQTGIGGTSPNASYMLDVNGNIHTNASVIAGSTTLTSDRRLKRNITALNSALANVMKLAPVSYEKKSSISASDYSFKEMGFVAQDLQKVFPQLVHEGSDADKTLSVDYNSLIPVLTKAIQEQQAQNDTQVVISKAQSDAQVAQIAGLKQAIVTMAAQNAEIIAHNKTLDAQNRAITAQLSDMAALKLAVAQLTSQLNKTTVTQAVLPIPVTVKN